MAGLYLVYELANEGSAILVMDDDQIKGEVENDRNCERVSKQIMGFIHGREAA